MRCFLEGEKERSTDIVFKRSEIRGYIRAAFIITEEHVILMPSHRQIKKKELVSTRRISR